MLLCEFIEQYPHLTDLIKSLVSEEDFKDNVKYGVMAKHALNINTIFIYAEGEIDMGSDLETEVIHGDNIKIKIAQAS